jgi:predicted DNA-binding protein (MmcQ/YjbR family)
MVTRADILAYAKEKYNTDPERLWAKYPEYEVLRHRNNKKWYVILMDVPGNKVGLETDEVLDIIDIKCEPDMILTLSTQTGFAPAYHMNKKHWLTILLNGSVNDDEIYNLLDMSYEMTK